MSAARAVLPPERAGHVGELAAPVNVLLTTELVPGRTPAATLADDAR